MLFLEGQKSFQKLLNNPSEYNFKNLLRRTMAAEACETDLAEEVCEESLQSEGEVLDEPELAVKGIHLLVNNKWPEAEKLFHTYK